MNSIRLEDYCSDMPNMEIFNSAADVKPKTCLKVFKQLVEEVVSKGESFDDYLISVNDRIMRPLTLAILLENAELVRTVHSNSKHGLMPITIRERSGCAVIKISASGRSSETIKNSALLLEAVAMDAVVSRNNPELISLVIPNVDMLPFSYLNKLVTGGKHELISSLSGRIKDMYDFPSLLSIFSSENLKRLFTTEELEEKILTPCSGSSWLRVFNNDKLSETVSQNFEAYLSLFNSDESRSAFAEKALLLISSHGYTIPDSKYYKDVVDVSSLDIAQILVAALELNIYGIKPVFKLANIRDNDTAFTWIKGSELYTLITSVEIISDGGFDSFERLVIGNLSSARLKKATKLGIFNSSNIKEALRYSCSLRAVDKTKILLEYAQTIQ